MILRKRPLEVEESPTFATAADLMVRELEEIGRKPSTLDPTETSSASVCCRDSVRSR
jgi:hypothetical protein